MIRRAHPAEAACLSELAFRSKAYWGYDAAFMEACRDDLTLTPEALAEPHYVLEQQRRIAGFYNLAETSGGVYLHNLFVDPEFFIGQGIGKRLWVHMVDQAEALGYAAILIESDPYAEAFYLSRGAKRTGSVPSSTIPGRVLPLLEFSLDLAENR